MSAIPGAAAEVHVGVGSWGGCGYAQSLMQPGIYPRGRGQRLVGRLPQKKDAHAIGGSPPEFQSQRALSALSAVPPTLTLESNEGSTR